jgi:SAM-dependent methyltransferase
MMTVARQNTSSGSPLKPPSKCVYESPRVAAAYAFARPPVHQAIIAAVQKHLSLMAPLGRALDVGCGAGRSTAALGAIAQHTVGIEPVETMLVHRRVVAPGLSFVVGLGEALPFASGAFDIATAAGSINYTQPGLFLQEAARVLRRDGVLVIYDFSPGRRFRTTRLLDEWYTAFEDRYPSQHGYALDPRSLPFANASLRLDDYRELMIDLPMSAESYVRYVMSESGVELAIAQGTDEKEILEWCTRTLHPLFGDEKRGVLFDAYTVYVRRVEGSRTRPA